MNEIDSICVHILTRQILQQFKTTGIILSNISLSGTYWSISLFFSGKKPEYAKQQIYWSGYNAISCASPRDYAWVVVRRQSINHRANQTGTHTSRELH